MQSIPSALLVLVCSLLVASQAAADPLVAGLVPVSPVPDAIRARIPEDGLWFASVGEAGADGASPFFVYQVRRDGVFEAYREDKTQIYSYGWSDPDTLWTIAFDGDAVESKGVIVTRFMRGTKEREYRVGKDTWLGPGSGSWVELHLGPVGSGGSGGPGEVALVRCEDMDIDVVPERCRRSTSRRLEGDEWIYRAKLAKGTKDVVHARYATPLPKALKKAPPGYTVKKAKVDGFVGLKCSGPNGEDSWPQDYVINREMQVQPKKLTWIHDKPPLLVVEGPRQTPIEMLPKETQVLRGCPAKTLWGFHWLGDGIWAELVDMNDTPFTAWQWKIWVDDTHVASLHGGMGHLVPAPRPAEPR